MKKIALPFLFLTLFVFSGCRYRSAKLIIDGNSVITTSIPVIKKDSDGYLRNYLAREMATNRSLYYSDSKARYELRVDVIKDGTSKISYMWDRSPC